MRPSPIGRLLLPVLVFVFAAIFLASSGFERPAIYALAAAAVFELAFWILRRSLRKRRLALANRQAVAEHKAKQREFDRRFADAQRTGALNRFKDPTQ